MSLPKYSKWVPSQHPPGKWRVTVPAKLSETGKRRDQYFDTKKEAEKFIANTLGEREEHGKQTVSSEERHWIGKHIKRLAMNVSTDSSRIQEFVLPENASMLATAESSMLSGFAHAPIGCRADNLTVA